MVEFRDVGTPACTRITNREIALRGWPPRSSSAREEGDGTQDFLPRTTTTLVVLKTSGTRAQTADSVVVKYLDHRARAPTMNRRPRSGVGGVRRGVREYGAVNYHKVELIEQRKTKQFSRQAVL